MDFLDNIKLVNYVRSQVKAGNLTPDVSSKAKFEDEIYLKPVQEDDALLYSLDDVLEGTQSPDGPGGEAERRVLELQEDLERLQTQFSEYKLAVQKSMDEQLSKEDEKLSSSASPGPAAKRPSRIESAESDYFSSYSYNGIPLHPLARLGCLADPLMKLSTSQCSRMPSVPTPIGTSPTTINISSRIRLCWMWDPEQEYYPCSARKLGRKRSFRLIIRILSTRPGRTSTTMAWAM